MLIYSEQRDLESTVGKLKCDIALSKEQNSTLESKMKDLESEVNRREEFVLAMKELYEGRMKDQAETCSARIEAEAKRAGRIEDELELARASAQALQDKLSVSLNEAQSLREQLNQAKLPSPLHMDEVNSLKSALRILEAEKHRLLERAKTVEIRYRQGDLVRRQCRVSYGDN